MEDVWERRSDRHSLSNESYPEKLRTEPIYEAFLCPLTKNVMHDPVTLENGNTFEREAIEKWFKECKDSGRKPVCPLTLKELSSTTLNPSISLRNTIEEWKQRNDAVELDIACRSLSVESSENDILQALQYIQNICQKRRSPKNILHNADLIPMITDMLKCSDMSVRCKALETLRVVVEDDDDNKEVVALGDNIRTIIKFLSHGHVQERLEAISLLFELSKSGSVGEKIGGVYGAILILVGMASSNSENVLSVQKTEMTLQNLEKCENNVLQMAENGRLQPLLNLLRQGSYETKLVMASHLGELVLNNDMKVLVVQNVGSILVDIMRHGNLQAREAALRALNQISSYEFSARLLIELGILPPLVRDLFAVGANQLPMKLKEVAATVLANVVASGADFESIPLDNDQSLVSEDIIHNLLHLISNTGPAIESKLLQVLVGLTSNAANAQNIVAAIKSSGATISLIQFIEAPQRELRLASIKLLHNISPYMGRELTEALCGTTGQLSSLIKIISDDEGISEEQAAAIGLLAELPERDLGLTQHLLNERAFNVAISKLRSFRQGSKGGRYVTPFLEGLVRVLSRITYALENEPAAVALAREQKLAVLFSDLLQTNGMDSVQVHSALSLENLSLQSKCLTVIPQVPDAGFCSAIFPCFSKPPVVNGLCRVHHGICSIEESFCLVEGRVVERLIACLDHANEKVIEASLSALSSLLGDGVDVEQGVSILCSADGIKPILGILVENRTEVLRTRSVWAVERILRVSDIAFEISVDASISAALVHAFQHSDYRTKQIAEQALRHLDRLPNFSGIFPRRG